VIARPVQTVGQWTTAQIHDTVAAIARQPAYAVPLRRSILGRAIGFLFDRLSDLLELIKGSRDFRFVVIAAAGLVVLAVAGRIVIARQSDISAGRGGRGLRGARGEYQDPWAFARELASSHDYLGASHALYAAVVDTLTRGGAIKFHTSKTSGDYTRELRWRGSPAFDDFRAFARQFDRTVYGSTLVNADDYERLARVAERAASTRAAA
jgi:hypothetical protein